MPSCRTLRRASLIRLSPTISPAAYYAGPRAGIDGTLASRRARTAPIAAAQRREALPTPYSASMEAANSAAVWKRCRCPSGRRADGESQATRGIRGYPGYVRLQCRTLAPRLRHQHVLHVADEG